MELNFFDTPYNMSVNIFLSGRKYFLFSFVSKYGHDNAETVAAVGRAKVDVEIEQTGISTVVVIATTFEEVARIREVRVIV